jgi:hypothetical protein
VTRAAVAAIRGGFSRFFVVGAASGVVGNAAARYHGAVAGQGYRMKDARSCFVAGALAMFAACGGSQTAEFGSPRTLPKDQRPTVWDAPAKDRLGMPDMQGAQGGGASGEKVWSGTTPAGWEPQPAQPSRFRDAVWRVAGNADTECYLTASASGPIGSNLDRWYKQFGITPVPALESLPLVELAGRPARLAEIRGSFQGREGAAKAGWATLVAFVPANDVVAMSLRMTGPDAVVTANKDAFVALAKTLRSATASPDKAAPPIEPGAKVPANHPAIPGREGDKQQPSAPHGQTPAPGPSPFTATIPAGWTAKAGSQRALHHTFGSDGEVYVSQLGGTLQQNFGIWCMEMGQPQLNEAAIAALAKQPFLDGEGVLLDQSGNFQNMAGKKIAGARMLVAARQEGGSLTFAKLVGPAAEVAAQVEAFQKFCASLRRTP